MELELRINGVIAGQEIEPNQTVCSLLRREGYTSVKQGCETGECGACTVLVDTVPRPSCVMLAAQAGGCSLTTVEGLGMPGKLHALQTAFIECGAAPCGFCTPGMLLSAYALLQSNPSPTHEEVRDALSGNLCRCSGYAKPIQAVQRAAALMRGEEVGPFVQDVQEGGQVEKQEEQASLVAETMQAYKVSGAENGARVTTKIPVITPEMREMHSATVLATRAPVVPPKLVVGKALPASNGMRLVTGKPTFVADSVPAALLHGRLRGIDV
jgi:putative selenate reductase molybdopterin-binding subunit